MKRLKTRLQLTVASAALLTIAGEVQAQSQRQSNPGSGASSVQEVVVTARKRAETLMSTPVTVQALSQAQLSRNPSSDLESLTEMLPNVTASTVGSGSLGSYNIRGIGGANSGDVGVDQDITIVIDDVPVSRGSAASGAYFDLANIQVLPGPQALYFGKNADGGVISLTSMSPTQHFEAYAKVGYEFYDHERYFEGAVSGPLTDTLSARLAFRYDQGDGWLKNVAGPAVNPYESDPSFRAQPGAASGELGANRTFVGRLSLVYKPTSNFTVTFKGSLIQNDGDDEAGTSEVLCPAGGRPHQFDMIDPYVQCKTKVNGVTSIGAMNPLVAKYYPESNGGVGYETAQGGIGSLKLEYETGPVSLTSITGYYNMQVHGLGNYSYSAIDYFPGVDAANDQQISEEVRMNTHFDGPLNFIAGVFYDHELHFGETIGRGLIYGFLPPVNSNTQIPGAANILPTAIGYWPTHHSTIDTYSAFVQGSWKITPTLTLDAGARYTDIEGSSNQNNAYIAPFYLSLFAGVGTGAPCNSLGLPVITACLFVPPGEQVNFKYSENNISPEVTLTWKPGADLTLYGAFKTGYKPGGISAPSVLLESNLASDLNFGPEKALGGEVGLKGTFFDRRLSIISSLYYYQYTALQLNEFDSQTTSFFIRNAGAALTKGVEVQGAYQASPELSFSGIVDYNDGYFSSYPGAACYVGQTAAQGCVTSPAGTSLQDLSGKPLPNAPRWVVTTGFSWNHPVSKGLNLGLDGDLKYSSKYAFTLDGSPLGVQDGFMKLNARLRMFGDDNRWELAVIGRNLTNQFVAITGTAQPGTGNAQDNFAPEYTALVDRGREVTLQFTVRR